MSIYSDSQQNSDDRARKLLCGIVTHSKLGPGVVESISSGRVEIRFSINEPPRKFKYPDVFESLVAFKDPVLNAIAQEICSAQKAFVKEAEKQTKEKAKQLESTASPLFKAQKADNKTKRAEDQIPSVNSAVTNTYDSDPRFDKIGGIETFNQLFIPALKAEIAYLIENGGKRIKLFDGKFIDTINGVYYYTFEVDSELNYPEDTPITIYYNGNNNGKIVFCEEMTVTISCGIKLPDSLPVLEISADPWMLLDALIKKLEDLETDTPVLTKKLITEGRRKIKTDSTILKGQDSAVESAGTNPITFIWGPPGTGKTETLAKIALDRIVAGDRVLMLSYSNISVDGAAKRVWKMAEKNGMKFLPGDILRYGYPRDPEVKDIVNLTSRDYAMRNNPELLNQQNNLQNQLQKLPKASKEYITTQKSLNELRKQLKATESDAIQDAVFVATTVSKAVVDSAVFGQLFDVVIFDEASMAFIPQIVYSASLAKSHFICMGDFMQLPPIVQSDDDSPLCSDIFDYCGITKAVEEEHNHEWLCLLDTQYRMHPEIAGFVSKNMYHSLLKTAENLLPEKLEVSKHNPIRDSAIGFANLSGMMTVCTKTGDGSKINVLSALIAFGFALVAAKDYEVGIITPYHAQARLLRSMISDAAADIPHKITASTVHQFQGSENKVIIFDAVECYRQAYIGSLLSSRKRNTANRLFNVAVTRAEGKFIALANIDYFLEKRFSKRMLFRNLIDRFNKGNAVSAAQIPVELKDLNTPYRCMSEKSSEEDYYSDLKNANQEIRIDIPGKLKDADYSRLVSILRSSQNKGVSVIIRAENIDIIPEDLRKYTISNAYVTNPVTIIDKSLTWFGKPDSRAVFIIDDRGIPCKARPVIRIKGKATSKALFGLLEMNRTKDQKPAEESSQGSLFDYLKGKVTCSVCGKPMKLRKSKRGMFLGCSGYPNCNNIQQIDPDLINEYFLKNNIRCPRCESRIKASVTNGRISVKCLSPSQHVIDITKL